jgi:hypothetical protein
MKTLTVRKLHVVTVANFAAVLSAAVAGAMVVGYWVLALLNFAQLNAYFPDAVHWNAGFGLLAIIVIPALYALVGWVGGAIVAWFYNVALGGSKGIMIDVDE